MGGGAVMRRGQAWDFFVVLFFFLIYGLISLLRYYALVPVLSVFLVVGLVWFSNLACGLGQLAFTYSLLQVVLWGGQSFFEQLVREAVPG